MPHILYPSKGELEKARTRIKPYIHRTPVLTSLSLDTLTGCRIAFKCENFQKAGAFKARGAANAVFSIEDSELLNGVATHSSGNHAAALSLAARNKGIPAYIVMPENSSRVKIAAVESYGGIITFCKPTLQAREDTLKAVIGQTGATEIHPYNDLRIIAGQASAALELLEAVPAPDFILAPVGGGGLLSGTALAAHYYSPKTRVIAAEPEGADDARQSFITGSFVPQIHPETVADGLRTSLGSLTFPIILKFVDDILTVNDEQIIKAMKLIWERMKILVEPSSAVPFAVILANKDRFAGKNVGLILSGGNIDLDTLPW